MHKNKFYRKPKKEDFTIPGCPTGVRVPNGNIEAALRKFKKQVKEFGIISDFADRRVHIKKSAKKRKQKEEAVERLRREVVKQKIIDKNSCF